MKGSRENTFPLIFGDEICSTFIKFGSKDFFWDFKDFFKQKNSKKDKKTVN